MSEDSVNGPDRNNNGTTRDSLGGSIINPTTVTIRYVDSDGNEIKASEQATGMKTDKSSYLTDYGTAPSAILAPPLDSTAPTAAETADIQTGFAQYYRVGQSITFTPPTITGYDTPTARTTTLGADNNTVTFTYTATSHDDGNDNNNGNDNTNGGGANNNNNGTNTNSDTSTLANTGADLTP